MAKLKTVKLSFDGTEKDEFKISFDVNVNKDGTFATTLPKEIIQIFESANIDLDKNQIGNKGYFNDTTCDGLIQQVSDCCKEYMSREMVSEKIVIRYVIQTTCAYCLDINGAIVPNAQTQWTQFEERPLNDWKQGTESQHAASPHPFSISIYAKPHYRRDYKYKSGKTKIEYKELSAFGGGDATAGYYLKWLEGVSTISKPQGGTVQEIDYNEDVAKVFVDMLKGICAINEKIKDFITPEAIKIIAENKQKFLG